MLDIKRIKEDPNGVKAALHAKEVDCDETIDRILALDEQRRELIASTETRKARQNKVSKDIPALKKAGQDVSAVFAEMAELKSGIAADACTRRSQQGKNYHYGKKHRFSSTIANFLYYTAFYQRKQV